MRAGSPRARGKRNDDREVCLALIEAIHRDDEHWTPARLFMPARRIEIREPYVTATGLWHWSLPLASQTQGCRLRSSIRRYQYHPLTLHPRGDVPPSLPPK